MEQQVGRRGWLNDFCLYLLYTVTVCSFASFPLSRVRPCFAVMLLLALRRRDGDESFNIGEQVDYAYCHDEDGSGLSHAHACKAHN